MCWYWTLTPQMIPSTAIRRKDSFTVITIITAFCLYMYSVAVNCLLRIFDLGHRPCVAQPGDSEIIGYEVPSAVAEREDYLSW
jgi:hypothetical protein